MHEHDRGREAREVEQDLEWRAGVEEAREESLLELARLLSEQDDAPDQETKPLFKLGRVVYTPGALSVLQEMEQDPTEY